MPACPTFTEGPAALSHCQKNVSGVFLCASHGAGCFRLLSFSRNSLSSWRENKTQKQLPRLGDVSEVRLGRDYLSLPQ